jgi:NitT/TauT family transport system substrate-binding protein
MPVHMGVLLTLLLVIVLPREPQAQERIIVSYSGTAAFDAPAWAAKDLGLFEKYGLNVDLVMVLGGARGMQALVSGSTHFHQGSVSAPLTLGLQGGDIAIVGASLNKFPFSVVVQKEIRRPSDLIGKKIGIIGFGGSNEAAVLLALKEWKIPRQEVTLVPSGGEVSRLAAMNTKAIDATVLSPPHPAEAVRAGMNILAHMSDLKANFPQTGITVRRSFLSKNRETVSRFLQAYTEAIHHLNTNKERSIKVYAKWLRQENPKYLDETYNYFAGRWSLPPRASRDGIRNALELLNQTRDNKTEIRPDYFLDESVVDELEREGFFARFMGTQK